MRLFTDSILSHTIDCVGDLLVVLVPAGTSRFYDHEKAESPMQAPVKCAKF